MDKKLLDALNNVSDALTLLSETLQDKSSEAKSGTANALQSSNIGEKLKTLELSIQNIEKDTKEILKNQKTIIDLTSKKEDKTGPISQLGSDPKKKQSIKDGLSMILMIAAGVMAIGLAFAIVGKVDFLSVIALSIALPLVAMAFEKIAQMKDLKPSEMVNVVIVTLAISAAIVGSSYLLGMVQPVGIFQLFTAVFIAAMFGAVAFGIGNLITGLKDAKVSVMEMSKIATILPIALVGISLAIAGSSFVLQAVKPVGLFQLITAVFIAAAFGAIGFGIGKLLEGISQFKDPTEAAAIALIMPIVLVGVATAIAISSIPLSMIRPIGLFQFITAVMIAISFIPISFALPYIAKAIEDINVGKIILLPIILIAIAGAIYVSSLIFSQIPAEKITFELLFKVISLSVALGTMALIFGGVVALFDKIKLDPVKAIEGGITVAIIAAAVMATSIILSIGNYSNYPSVGWSLSVGLSLLGFSVAVVGLGLLASTGIGAVVLLAGAASVLLIAGAVVATAAILSSGNYGNYPPISWSASVGLSLLAFGSATLMLGTFILGTFGLGGAALAAGAEGVKMIAQSIVDTAAILSTGSFKGGPTKTWAEGVSLALGAFSPIYAMLVANKIMSIFGGGIGPEDFSQAIITISEGINQAATFFSGKSFLGGPKKEWAEGVGQAIGAFAPVYAVLAENSGIFSSGISPEDMKSAIMTISQGIVDAANFFAENKASFDPKKAPDAKWSTGIGEAIKAFVPVFDFLSKNSGFFSGDADQLMKKGIKAASESIVEVSKTISGGNYSTKIDPNFFKNLSDSVKKYVEIINFLADKEVDDFDILEDYADGLVSIADAYAEFAESIESLNTSLGNLDMEKLTALKTLTGGIVLMSLMDADQFSDVMDALEEKADIFVETINSLESSSSGTTAKPVAGAKAPAGSSVKTATPQTDNMSQILSVLARIDANLGSIATDAKSIQDHIISSSETTTDLKRT